MKKGRISAAIATVLTGLARGSGQNTQQTPLILTRSVGILTEFPASGGDHEIGSATFDAVVFGVRAAAVD
jgi:hypothetical protein